MASQTATCAHHWVLGSPDRGTSAGVCKMCGAEKEFSNHAPKGWGPGRGGKKK